MQQFNHIEHSSVLRTGKRACEAGPVFRRPEPDFSRSLSMLQLVSACVVTMLAVGTVFMNQSIFLELADSFHLNVEEARYAFSVISLCYSLTFIVAGPLADILEPRLPVAAGCLGLALLLFFMTGTKDYGPFLTCLGLMGIAAALVPASMFPYVARLVTSEQSGIYVGAIVASATLGIVVGRVALGALTGLMGWQGAYLVFSVLFLLLAILSFFVFKTENWPGRMKVHVFGLYARMAGMLVNPAVVPLLLAGFCLFFGFLGAITFLTYRLAAPPFLFSGVEVGYLSFAGITAIVSPFSGGLSRRIGAYRILIPGLVVCLIALQLFRVESVAMIVLAVLLLFLGVYACQPLLFLFVGQRIPAHAVGCASALYILCCIGGGSVASMSLGVVWNAYGWGGITAACTGAVSIAMALLVVDAKVHGQL